MSAPEVVLEPLPELSRIADEIVPELKLCIPQLSLDTDALVKIVTDAVSKKPESVDEALKLLASLQGKIAEWVVSELPEKDKILAGLKMAETVAASVGCLPCFRK